MQCGALSLWDCFLLYQHRGQNSGESGGEYAGQEIDNVVVKECNARVACGGTVAVALLFGKCAADGAGIFDLEYRAEEGVKNDA